VHFFSSIPPPPLLLRYKSLPKRPLLRPLVIGPLSSFFVLFSASRSPFFLPPKVPFSSSTPAPFFVESGECWFIFERGRLLRSERPPRPFFFSLVCSSGPVPPPVLPIGFLLPHSRPMVLNPHSHCLCRALTLAALRFLSQLLCFRREQSPKLTLFSFLGFWLFSAHPSATPFFPFHIRFLPRIWTVNRRVPDCSNLCVSVPFSSRSGSYFGESFRPVPSPPLRIDKRTPFDGLFPNTYRSLPVLIGKLYFLSPPLRRPKMRHSTSFCPPPFSPHQKNVPADILILGPLLLSLPCFSPLIGPKANGSLPPKFL